MAFKRLSPRRGTVIPEDRRPPGSINAALHELPAYREYTHDLRGVVLYLPRTRFVVVPTRLVGGGDAGMYVMIVHPRGGYDIDCSEWELQRALRVVLDLAPVDSHPGVRPDLPGVMVAETADGHMIKVRRETPVVVEPEPGAFDSVGRCRLCGVHLPAMLMVDTSAGVQCSDSTACADRIGGVR